MSAKRRLLAAGMLVAIGAVVLSLTVCRTIPPEPLPQPQAARELVMVTWNLRGYPESEQAARDWFHQELAKLMPDVLGTPMGMMARVYSGVETLAYLWADAPDALRDLFEVMERNHLDAFLLAATSEADALVGMDDTSTTVISPRMFGEVCLAYTDHIAEAAHEAGKFYFHHSCGLIRNLLPLYRQTKMDAVHAFQIPPIGDVTIAEGKRLLGPRITIIASLVQMCGSLADRAAVERSIRQMFEDACPGDNVILGVAADPEKTMEETAFVVASCMKYRDLALTASAAK